MEARIHRAAWIVALLVVSMGARYETPNFVMQTADPRLAEQFGKAAEQYRHDLAVAWLGKSLPDWSQPCVVTAQVGNVGAGGATTFVFDRGEVFGWRMTIQGSAQRILDSVLPHEITHMILACHFRRPLPRWADEGAATSVEHPSERAKHYKMLVEFLRSNRGIAFKRMFAMEEYPRDMMPLYAQGYTLAEFLIQRGGRARFLEFLSAGLENDQWSEAIHAHYGYQDLGTLQKTWLAWVGQGFPPLQPSGGAFQLADAKPGPPSNSTYPARASHEAIPVAQARAADPGDGRNVSLAGAVAEAASVRSREVLPASGWRAAETRSSTPAPAVAAEPAPSPGPVRSQVAHPQPVGRPHQIILEWRRN
jgi:hypothetical protein